MERRQVAESRRIVKSSVTEWKALGVGHQEDVGVDCSSTTARPGELGHLRVASASPVKQGKY